MSKAPHAAITGPVIDARALFEYVLNLQRSLDLNEVANVAVNDGRLLWGVDRVSLALRRGARTSIVAVSGQDSVHPRGNLIRSMCRLAELVIVGKEPLKYDGAMNDLPPQLEEPLAKFIQESTARFLLIVPLFEPERLVPPDRPPDAGKIQKEERKTFGALIIEQMTSGEPSDKLQTIEIVLRHLSTAVFNSKTHSGIFLLPLWRRAGRFLEWLRGRRLVIAGAILLAVTTFCAALIVVPWTYRVDATGQLMPVIQRDVFAPWDGQIVELFAEGGQRVEKDQILLKMRSDELAAELLTFENRVMEKSQLLSSLTAQRDDAEKQGNRDEAVKAQGKSVETKVEIEGAKLQLDILKNRRERLTVRAPIAGVVTTFQVAQLLLNRPVKRGEVLLQVMDDTGDWHLELEIAEQRVGRILKAQINALNRQTDRDKENSSDQLAVEYRLLTQPESSYFAKLTQLATRAETTEAQGCVLEGRAALDKSNLPARAIGAEVRARIDCGTSCLGDFLFGDVVEFALKYLWW